ncbi:hypothetical protein FS837_008029 [Tulasnella sp. UAMH 9824]|nr:hypothetical protein FS837_008029 [Tulasnella sp. UAMH 9824]
MQDFAWIDWASAQVDRVWDLMDISFMRAASKGYDSTYKSILWNLSQNVDRQIGSSVPGISPCMTPTMIPYLNFRGGPMLGVEALGLQGLPVDELVLTRETEDNLSDLAGNAMSSTVVGTAMVVALYLCGELLCNDIPKDPDADMAIDQDENKIPGEDLVSGFDQLAISNLDLAKLRDVSLKELLEKAQASARLCACEGRSLVTTTELTRCQDCGHTACTRCGGRPEHNYTVIDVEANPRMRPLAFQKEAKEILPMRVELVGVSKEKLEALKKSAGIDIKHSVWESYKRAVSKATSLELHYHALKRQSIWVAVYHSPVAFLELNLDPKNPEWRLYAKPDPSEPMNSPVRRMLDRPVARLRLSEALFEGEWEFALPHSTSFNIRIKGIRDPDVEGEGLVPGWEPRLGLQRPELKNKKVWSRLEVTVPEENKADLDTDIAGIYRWLPGCAAANASLHVQEGRDDSLPPLFFFLDPSKWGENDEDPFVFSSTFRRYDYGEARPIFASIDTRYRQSDTEDTESVACHVLCRWVAEPAVKIQTASTADATFGAPPSSLTFKVGIDDCQSAQAILTCKVRLPEGADDMLWPKNAWSEVDQIHERKTFQEIAFLTERLREVPNQGDWLETSVDSRELACATCSPTPPQLHWVLDPKAKGGRGGKRSALALEDPAQAGIFELSLKNRPSPFVTQLRRDDEGFGHVRIGINIASLTHRVTARLPSENRHNPIHTSYRITTDYMPPAKLTRPKFVLKSNRRDPAHKGPPGFRIPLRPEQLRSLTWMVAQERADVDEFEEEEVVEAIVEPLGWRAEAKATRKVRVRGGVLADEVGYGKTAITLGLISCSLDKEWKVPKSSVTRGLIPTQATLIIVPAHLVKQWESEVSKFTKKNRMTVVAVYTAMQLKKRTVEEFLEADIVIVPSNLFSSNTYLPALAAFGAVGALPGSFGRYFRERLETTIEGVRAQAKRLQDDGAEAVWDAIVEGDKIDTSLHEAPVIAPSKRLRGRAFREMAEARALAEDDNAAPATGRSPTKPGEESASTLRPGTGQRMRDVYIDVSPSDLPHKYIRVDAPSRVEEIEIEDSDDAKPSLRKRTSRRSLIESDSEEEVPKKASVGRKQRKAEEEDYEMEVISSDESFSADESEESVQTISDEESDSDSKGKAKPKPKPKPKAPSKPAKKEAAQSNKKRKSTAVSDGEEGKKPAKKTKAPAKEKPSVASQDPWKLQSKPVKKEWKEMQCPILEMFYWNRVVVDEYTYLKDEAHALITKLESKHRWILSGTPPIHDFASLKTIAVFLGIHLGVDDEDENPTTRGSERTAVEAFHSFREIRSVDWYAHRYEVGQRFLDQYVRQNIAEIDEIIFHEHIELIQLPAAERALERELDHTLRAQDMMIKRGKKTQSDRDQRIMKSLREAKSAEEALIKCVAYYDNVQSGEDNAMKACDYVVKVRKAELEDCQRDIYKTLQKLEKQRKALGKTEQETHYQEWIRVTKSSGVGDHEATRIVLEIYEAARTGAAWSVGGSAAKKGEKEEESTESSDEPRSKKGKTDSSKADAIWEHRQTAHALRQLVRELIGRVRSYRYFGAVRDIQEEHVEFTIDCPRCGRKAVPRDEISLLSSCGHMGCSDCVKACTINEECVRAGTSECQASAQALNIVPASSLGTDDEIKDARRHFGKKLEVVVDLIKNRIPKDERVILFIQYEDLMKKVLEALRANKIACLLLSGTAMQQSEKLSHFQSDEAKEKVLVLALEDESASGANLTIANHAIFLSPLFAKSKEHFKATETQAIGRVRRYGQVRPVHIWRFVARDTIDVEVYERFSGRNYQREVDEAAAAAKSQNAEMVDLTAPAPTVPVGEKGPRNVTSRGEQDDRSPPSTRAPSTVSSTAEVSAVVASLSMAHNPDEDADVEMSKGDVTAPMDDDGDELDDPDTIMLMS